MNFKSTLIAVLLLAGLGSWYYFYEVKGKDKRDKAKEDQKLVFKGFEASSVLELAVRQPGGDLALKKVNGEWRVLNPVSASADAGVLDSMLEALHSLKQEEVVDEAGKDLANFGLASPAATVSFASGSGTARSLLFGMDSPTGQYAYAKLGDAAPVFLVQKSSKSGLVKEAKDVRNKKVWDFQAPEVASIKSSFGPTVSLERDKGSRWSLVAPVRDAGNQDTINSWVQQLAGLRIEDFVQEDGKNLAKYGLSAPAARLELGLGASKRLVLLGGKAIAGKKGRYYRVEGQPLVFSMAEYVSATLEKKPADLVDKEAFSLKSFEVARFDVARGGKTLTARKKDNQWSWEPARPKKEGEADFDFYGFVSSVSSAPLKRRLPKETKIPSPSLVLSFYGDKDALLEKITVGSKGKDGVAALSQSKGQAIEVAEDLFAKLPPE